mmetsp:Transcript_31285/g.69278  ORF Transcript_31285/g.69278 Transcript_31285/m.69278 type:complete len:95 (-) Transcript_31285:8-292(-)
MRSEFDRAGLERLAPRQPLRQFRNLPLRPRSRSRLLHPTDAINGVEQSPHTLLPQHRKVAAASMSKIGSRQIGHSFFDLFKNRRILFQIFLYDL